MNATTMNTTPKEKAEWGGLNPCLLNCWRRIDPKTGKCSNVKEHERQPMTSRRCQKKCTGTEVDTVTAAVCTPSESFGDDAEMMKAAQEVCAEVSKCDHINSALRTLKEKDRYSASRVKMSHDMSKKGGNPRNL